MTQPEFPSDPTAAVACVQGELATFRDEYLPALLGDTPADCLADWQRKTDGLADRLLGRSPPMDDPPPDLDGSGYVVRGGKFVWRVQVFVPIEAALRCPVFRDDPDDGTDLWDRVFRRVEEVKAWIYRPQNENALWSDTLCLLLPFVAEVDPEFVRRSLDRQTWRSVVLADRTCPEEQRARCLRLVDGAFGNILNNSLLHVLAGLANNHFGLIRGYLAHPDLYGGYTALMPRYVYEVLAFKVRTLRRLAGERPEEAHAHVER